MRYRAVLGGRESKKSFSKLTGSQLLDFDTFSFWLAIVICLPLPKEKKNYKNNCNNQKIQKSKTLVCHLAAENSKFPAAT